jgi:hypothetical protein
MLATRHPAGRLQTPPSSRCVQDLAENGHRLKPRAWACLRDASVPLAGHVKCPVVNEELRSAERSLIVDFDGLGIHVDPLELLTAALRSRRIGVEL